MIVRQFFHAKCESLQFLSTHLQKYYGLLCFSYPDTKIIGLLPRWQLVAVSLSQTLYYQRVGLDYQVTPSTDDFLTMLKQQWLMSCQWDNHFASAKHLDLGSIQQTARDTTTEWGSSSGFTGGLLGFIGYDLAASQSVSLKDVQSPLAVMGDYDVYLKQEQDGWQLYGPDCAALSPFYAEIEQIFKQLEVSTPTRNDLIAHNQQQSTDTIQPARPFRMTAPFAPQWTVEQYQSAFEKIQQYLIQGDCYQVNLTQPFKASLEGRLIDAFDALVMLSKASYAGYLQYEDFELLSCSPELFIEFKAGGEMLTRPIKGTRPRHTDALQDAALKQQLIHSEKDRAENLMIVDLLRNDLGHYAQTGSVSVPALFEVESFAQVHHLVSEIRATLKPDVSVLDVLFNALPGGSITGAPKIRAMQIIDELEAEARGAYCGSMGYLNYDNTGCFNILIRSLQKRGHHLTAWAGGGITIASNCEEEYQECLDKIGAILNCITELSAKDD